jgi:hypothetical protein
VRYALNENNRVVIALLVGLVIAFVVGLGGAFAVLSMTFGP